MQRTISSLIGYAMQATDGEIGNVEEFYFDDQSWVIRYLIVKTGHWFSEHEVLISPGALIKQSWEFRTFPVNLTKEQVRNSPGIDTDKPVSRQQEIELYGHYLWQPYWESGLYHDAIWKQENPAPASGEEDIKNPGDDLHLRSTENVRGYHIHGTDGEIGHIKDYIIDDQTWGLQNLIVDTHNFIGGKKILIPVRHIKEIQWYNSLIFVDMTIDSIKNSPVFDDSVFAGFENEGSGNGNIHLK
jgi:sporulation protein YlmC with PRC-barrel domain